MVETILEYLQKKGYPARILSVKHLKELHEEIEKLNEAGYLDPGMYKLFNDFHNFNLPESPNPARSIFIVASSSPVVKIIFNYNGAKFPALIPPTYTEYFKKPEEIKQCLNEILESYGYYAVRVTRLPEKLIAVRSGLAEYGANNITYIPEFGSFFLLSAFYSNLPCTDADENWNELRVMDICNSCHTCITKCPTAAITEERFLVKAERCLTYHNEFKGTPDFPGWIAPESHNCLVGCLRCQLPCPLNRGQLENIEELAEIDENETSLILENRNFEELPPSLAAKLEDLNISMYYHHLSSNLKALIYQKYS